MEKTAQRPWEGWLIRCPRLGGEVGFSYCEQEGGDLPCRRVVGCWQAAFPVETYLKGKMTQEAWERFCREGQRERIACLVEIVEGLGKGQKG